jgi:hypothetical protein
MASVGPRGIEMTAGGTVNADIMKESVAMPAAVTVMVTADGSVGTASLIAKRKGTDDGIGIGIGIGKGEVTMDESGIVTVMDGMPHDRTAQVGHQVETTPPKTLPI